MRQSPPTSPTELEMLVLPRECSRYIQVWFIMSMDIYHHECIWLRTSIHRPHFGHFNFMPHVLSLGHNWKQFPYEKLLWWDISACESCWSWPTLHWRSHMWLPVRGISMSMDIYHHECIWLRTSIHRPHFSHFNFMLHVLSLGHNWKQFPYVKIVLVGHSELGNHVDLGLVCIRGHMCDCLLGVLECQ